MATKTELPNGNGILSRAHAAEVQEQKITAAPKRRKTGFKKVDNQSLFASLCALVCDHQIGESRY